MRQRLYRARLSACVLVAGALLLAAAVPCTQARRAPHKRASRVLLTVPSSANGGERITATGRVAGTARARRIVLQGLSGAHWRALRRAALTHGRFRTAFVAPDVDGVLTVRAVLFRRSHRPLASRARRVLIRKRRQGAPPPAAHLGTRVAGWGNNGHRQLGGGFKNPFSDLPLSVVGLDDVRAAVATYFTSYALLADGTVRAWGGGDFGQLGNGSRETSSSPVAVSGLTGVTAIAAGGAHAMALLGNGTVATWGGNSFGQMGNATTMGGEAGSGSLVPMIVPGLTGVVAIAAGGADDAALLSNGTVVAWGENKHGQLGDGTTVEKSVPTPVRGLSNVKALALGGVGSLGGHMLALLGDGTVRAIGANGAGQLGDGTTTDSSAPATVKGLTGVVAISASVSHSMALLQNGTVVSWGSNAYGELGVTAGPETCGSDRVACSRVPVPVGLANATAISAGLRFSLAVSAGRTWAWGLNDNGQLGDGATANSSVPVPVGNLANVTAISAGEKHSLAVIRESGPAQLIEVKPGIRSLTIGWSAGQVTEPWGIRWRPVSQPPASWGLFLTLPPSTRSYTITGLSPQRYEVVVRNKAIGARNVTGTPLS